MLKIRITRNGFKSFSKDLEQIKKQEKRKIVYRVGETPKEEKEKILRKVYLGEKKDD